MAYKSRDIDGKWECEFCGKLWDTELSANACQKSHEIVLMQIKVTDLAALQRFLYSKNDRDLTESLIDTVRKYARKYGK